MMDWRDAGAWLAAGVLAWRVLPGALALVLG